MSVDPRHEHSVRSALWLPLFAELSDPMAVARLAAEAEEAGWHGVFVWDHLRWQAPVRQVADPWITLAAIAVATEQVRLGPMITPLPRRRPAKVAKETATLDRLSNGRLFLPRPVQRPGVSVWIAGMAGNPKPLRRAAGYDGFFPVNLHHPDQFTKMVARITDLRRHTTAPYDIAVGLPVGVDPLPYVTAGATWWLPELPPEEVSLDMVRGMLREGPLTP